MAATKYQILYRYANPNSNQFVLNDVDTKYQKVFEFYHDKHKIIIGTDEEILEANEEKSQWIINGNNTANDNYNMLFKFTGTKRVNKKVWMPEAQYVVIKTEEAIKLKDKVTDAINKNDYSGDYWLVSGDTVENGVVVAKKNPIEEDPQVKSVGYINFTSNQAENKVFFKDEQELMNLIRSSTIAELEETEATSVYGTLTHYSTYSGSLIHGNINIMIGYDFSSSIQPFLRYYGYNGYAYAYKAITDSTYYGIGLRGGIAYSTVKLRPDQAKFRTVPAHFEEEPSYPYMVCDTYERIEQSPWFVLSTCGSLTSALEKVKALVKAVGIENVKLIKVVPTDQFIKIK